jgi:UDP-galactopyranose mutase
MKEILVVGAGFSGAIISRELAEAGISITLIDERDHIGGNAYDYTNEYGIRVHKYGPHLFHTSNKKVFEYISKYTEWVEYKHKVKAQLENGDFVTLPVNKETKNIVGEENIIDIFFRPYTKKMWGKELEELNPEIINRIPIRNDTNEYYFPDDEFQYMPKDGYTKIFEKILDHPNIKVLLNTAFKKSFVDKYAHVFNSMPIDEFYEYRFGELPYRSIKFHNISIPSPKLLPVTTVNFTHNGPFTRITEWKNIPSHGKNSSMTTLTFEEPCDYKENNMQRYYPVKDLNGENRKIYKKYAQFNKENDSKITFIGRCGLYVYIDMHQAISSAIATARNFLKERNINQ